MAKSVKKAAGTVLPLYMNGLSGRMIRLAAPRGKKREILLVSGQHTSAERIYGLAVYLNRYGSVTAPDLPGFGGMDPFYKIGEKPTLDNMADYLATFVKLRYKKSKKFTIVAFSYGFAVATRMLQRYPDMAKRVNLLVSVSGVTHKQDFRWKRFKAVLIFGVARMLSFRIPAFLAKTLILRAPVIKSLYKIVEGRHPKLKDASARKRSERIAFEVELWKNNDFRTWTATCLSMSKLDLAGSYVELPVYHVSVDDDHYFNQVAVEEHMRQVYKDFILVKSHLPAHAPTVLATPEDVAPLIPPKIRALLRRPV